MKWSIHGQTPEYLALTRMVSLCPNNIRKILECVPIKSGMRVLDVGCGSGEYVFRLGNELQGVEFVGVDFDENFIEVARSRATCECGTNKTLHEDAARTCAASENAASENALCEDAAKFEPVNPQNTYTFVQGDGLHLPFESDSFDAVISHTYLTAIPDYQTALAEMIRTCKPGGAVSSITNMNNNFSGTGASGAGAFELFAPLLDPESLEIVQRVQKLRDTKMRYIDMGSGVPTYKVQRLFAHLLLEGVSAQPLSHYFCLSDAHTSTEDYIKFVDLLYEAEVKQTHCLQQVSAIDKKLTEDEWRIYYGALEKRREDLLGMLGQNQEWTWYGNTSLLVWGRVPNDEVDPGLNKFCKRVCDERKRADKMRRDAQKKGYKIHERYAQAGPGRVCTVQLRCKKRVVYASDFNPSLAFEAAYEILRNKHKKKRKRCEKAEASAWKKILAKPNASANKNLRPLDEKSIYCIDLMWDGVAETIEAGYRVEFFEVVGSGNNQKTNKEAKGAKNLKEAKGAKDAKSTKSSKENKEGMHKKDNDMSIVYVRCTRTGEMLQGVCAHADLTVAIRRAFSRAVSQLCPAFR